MTNKKFFTRTKPRPLPVIILADVSSSMGRIISGETEPTGETVFEDGQQWQLVRGGLSAINVLNQAVIEMIESFKEENVIGAEIQLCIITFGGSVDVHTTLQNISAIEWEDMGADGHTPMGEAFDTARNLLEDQNLMPSRGYRPAIILISDGEPTDNWEQSLKQLLNSERGQKADRMAMFIGDDDGEEMLKSFVNDPAKRVFRAADAKEIRDFFTFVTMSVTTRAQSKDLKENEKAIEFFKQLNE